VLKPLKQEINLLFQLGASVGILIDPDELNCDHLPPYEETLTVITNETYWRFQRVVPWFGKSLFMICASQCFKAKLVCRDVSILALAAWFRIKLCVIAVFGFNGSSLHSCCQ